MLEIQQNGNMKKYLSILKKSLLFHNIEESELLHLLKCLDAQIKSYKKGEIIFSEGKNYEQSGILISGALQIVQYDFIGNRSILAEIEPLQLFAEAYALCHFELPVNIEAACDSNILMLNSKKISTPCSTPCPFHLIIINNLLKILATNNIKLNAKIQCLSKRSTREKILNYLYSQAKKYKSNTFEIPFDRQNLADYLCVERSAMSAEISKLSKEQIIETKKNKFKLLKLKNF